MYLFHRKLQEMKHQPDIANKIEEGVPCPLCGNRSLNQIKKSCLRSHLSSKHLLYFPIHCGACSSKGTSHDEIACSCSRPPVENGATSEASSSKLQETRQAALEETLDGLVNLIEDYTAVKKKLATMENATAKAIPKPPPEPARRSSRVKAIVSPKPKAKVKKREPTERSPAKLLDRDLCIVCLNHDKKSRVIGFRNRRNHVLEHLENDKELEEASDFVSEDGINSPGYKVLYSRCFPPSSKGASDTDVRSTRSSRVVEEPKIGSPKSLRVPRVQPNLEADDRALEIGVFAEVLLRRLSPQDFPSVSWDRNSRLLESGGKKESSTSRPVRSRASRVTRSDSSSVPEVASSFRKNECRLCRKVIQSRYQLKHTLQEHYNKGSLRCPYCETSKKLHPSQLRQHVEKNHAKEDEVEKSLSRPFPEIQNLHQQCFPQPKEDSMGFATTDNGYESSGSAKDLKRICGICQTALSESESKEDHIYQHLASDEAKARFICVFPGCDESFFTLELILRHCKFEHSSKGDFKDMKTELKEDYLSKRRQCFSEEETDSDTPSASNETTNSPLKRKPSSWDCEFCDESRVSSPIDHMFAHLAIAEGLHRFRCVFEECQAGMATQSALIEHVKLVHSISEVCRGSIAIMDQISDPEMAKRAVIWWRSCFKNSNGRIPELIRRISNESKPKAAAASRRRPERFVNCRSCDQRVKPEDLDGHVSNHLEILRVFQFTCTLCHQNFKSWTSSEGHEHPSNELSREVLIRNRSDEPSFRQAWEKAKAACFGAPMQSSQFADQDSPVESMTHSATISSNHTSPNSGTSNANNVKEDEELKNSEIAPALSPQAEIGPNNVSTENGDISQSTEVKMEQEPLEKGSLSNESSEDDDFMEEDSASISGRLPDPTFDSISYGGFPM